MTTRDILDYYGNIIGQLTLPDETSEEEWTYQLSTYIVNPEEYIEPEVPPLPPPEEDAPPNT